MAIYEDAGRKREFVVPIPYKPPPSKKALDGLFFKSTQNPRLQPGYESLDYTNPPW